MVYDESDEEHGEDKGAGPYSKVIGGTGKCIVNPVEKGVTDPAAAKCEVRSMDNAHNGNYGDGDSGNKEYAPPHFEEHPPESVEVGLEDEVEEVEDVVGGIVLLLLRRMGARKVPGVEKPAKEWVPLGKFAAGIFAQRPGRALEPRVFGEGRVGITFVEVLLIGGLRHCRFRGLCLAGLGALFLGTAAGGADILV